MATGSLPDPNKPKITETAKVSAPKKPAKPAPEKFAPKGNKK